MGTRSTLPSWMLPQPRWCPRLTPHHWATQWTPSRRGTMMDSSLVSAKRHHQRNRAMRRERTRACQEFRGPKNKRLSFLLFRETTKEDAISYRDWHREIEDACREAMTPPRLRKLCSRPWRGWPGTMPR